MPLRILFSCFGATVRRALAGGAVIAVLSAGLAGCEGVPRDTRATPPPPREPITTGDEVYPAPTSVRDTRPAARAP